MLRAVENITEIGGLVPASLPDPAEVAELLASFVCSETLATDLAERLDLNRTEVSDKLNRVHSNLMPLLHSPEGWSALAAYVGSTSEAECYFTPTVH